jgi:hexosaminidase
VSDALVDRLGSLLPLPLSTTALGGDVLLSGVVTCSDGGRAAGELLRGYLAEDGAFPRVAPATPGPGGVDLVLDPTGVPPGDEAYLLVVGGGTGAVRVSARAVAGLRHGVQTLRQLAGEPGERERWRLPGVRITDAPRLPWRGALLDVGRWFMPLADLRRYVDVLAAHKLTTLHLHLTEDQGWRFESRRHPRLTEVGAWRRESPVGHLREGRGFDGTPHGGSYTQAELRDLVAFAALRGVEVVPEIDLPGHTTAAVAAYPELGNTDVTGGVEVATSWGVMPTVLNPQESTMRFVEDVLEEVLDVFPARHVHLGGDECPTQEWEASPAARARAAELHLQGPERLQSWFTARTCAFVRERGRVPVVWDEAADDPGLERDVVVMAWQDAERGVRAARRGHPVVMTPQQDVYLDHHASTEPDRPLAHSGLTTLADAYAFDAVPPGEPPEVAARVLGTQAQVWTEYLPTPADVDALAFPRLCAIADRAWSCAPPDHAGFRRRLEGHLPRLAALGVAVPPERMWGGA